MNSMNQSKNQYQGTWRGEAGHFFTIVHPLFLIPLLLIGSNVYAACVASITASTPTSQFIINVNGTVTDKKTTLMWKRCSEGKSWNGSTCAGGFLGGAWGQALAQAQTVNNNGGFAGYTDWRVPNVKELSSIVEDQCTSPSINATIFPDNPLGFYQSSSPYAPNGANSLIVSFYAGNVTSFSKTSTFPHVRLVRGGQ